MTTATSYVDQMTDSCNGYEPVTKKKGRGTTKDPHELAAVYSAAKLDSERDETGSPAYRAFVRQFARSFALSIPMVPMTPCKVLCPVDDGQPWDFTIDEAYVCEETEWSSIATHKTFVTLASAAMWKAMCDIAAEYREKHNGQPRASEILDSVLSDFLSEQPRRDMWSMDIESFDKDAPPAGTVECRFTGKRCATRFGRKLLAASDFARVTLHTRDHAGNTGTEEFIALYSFARVYHAYWIMGHLLKLTMVVFDAWVHSLSDAERQSAKTTKDAANMFVDSDQCKQLINNVCGVHPVVSHMLGFTDVRRRVMQKTSKEFEQLQTVLQQ